MLSILMSSPRRQMIAGALILVTLILAVVLTFYRVGQEMKRSARPHNASFSELFPTITLPENARVESLESDGRDEDVWARIEMQPAQAAAWLQQNHFSDLRDDQGDIKAMHQYLGSLHRFGYMPPTHWNPADLKDARAAIDTDKPHYRSLSGILCGTLSRPDGDTFAVYLYRTF